MQHKTKKQVKKIGGVETWAFPIYGVKNVDTGLTTLNVPPGLMLTGVLLMVRLKPQLFVRLDVI
ncbi:hypothetical protein HRbin02_00036 [Candidatus Calditenuaceae archaeon HR02]|nr:hypothetical protein HRbin02_00036 [Candidatus Calditenuaceae archaeon HR02]